MTLRSDRLTDLILGEKRSVTRRALVLAVGFVVAGAVLEYLLFRSEHENEVLRTVHEVFLLDGYFPGLHATGAFFVIGLAALHAYLNEGLLPSVLLGWSLAYGTLSWTVASFTGVEDYYLDPVSAFERTFPEAIVLAALGFVVGLGLRRIRKRRQTDAFPRSESV